jgi:hypothetical protein
MGFKPAALALVHYPVLDRRGDIVATALTNLDLHDLARTAMTFGVEKLYIVTPVAEQQRLAGKICEHWCQGYGATYNPLRKEALSLMEVCDSLETAMTTWEKHCGEAIVPLLTGASVNQGLTYRAGRELASRQPLLIIFGTGWGLAPSLFDNGWQTLEAIKGNGEYNHLPVRSAAAIIMDRLFGSEGRMGIDCS